MINAKELRDNCKIAQCVTPRFETNTTEILKNKIIEKREAEWNSYEVGTVDFINFVLVNNKIHLGETIFVSNYIIM